ncbi:glycosyltransferase family 4 protein, partial [Gillisia marina]|uniref:glycosyltransferase family 4 protein n=1 Tax=Gillisia marina TaxID=1167637 RepID=UPI00029AA2AA
MDIIIFTHPSFQGSQSMPKYANMLADGMRQRGHKVELWTATKFFYQIPLGSFLKKWLGYLDQFLVFPLKVKTRLKKYPKNTLFVFADQALGPWVPLAIKRPHVVHCHDFIALHSALHRIPENKVGFTGILYQKWIRNGFGKAKNFISISIKTKEDLHATLPNKPLISEVVYNGLNQNFEPGNLQEVRANLKDQFDIELKNGYILHVG